MHNSTTLVLSFYAQMGQKDTTHSAIYYFESLSVVMETRSVLCYVECAGCAKSRYTVIILYIIYYIPTFGPPCINYSETSK
jgi:hypothetical protein